MIERAAGADSRMGLGMPSSGAGDQPSDARANNFDTVRLLAALSVVFSHSFLVAEGSEASEPFVWLTGNQCILGLVGVFVFFIISGYLVTASFSRSPMPGRFAQRRVLRMHSGVRGYRPVFACLSWAPARSF